MTVAKSKTKIWQQQNRRKKLRLVPNGPRITASEVKSWCYIITHRNVQGVRKVVAEPETQISRFKRSVDTDDATNNRSDVVTLNLNVEMSGDEENTDDENIIIERIRNQHKSRQKRSN